MRAKLTDDAAADVVVQQARLDRTDRLARAERIREHLPNCDCEDCYIEQCSRPRKVVPFRQNVVQAPVKRDPLEDWISPRGAPETVDRFGTRYVRGDVDEQRIRLILTTERAMVRDAVREHAAHVMLDARENETENRHAVRILNELAGILEERTSEQPPLPLAWAPLARVSLWTRVLAWFGLRRA